MNTVRYLAVNGTHENRSSPDAAWSSPKSDLSKCLARYGLVNIADSAALPFDWSDDLDFTAGNHHDWIAGGAALFAYLVPPLHPQDAWPPAETVIITHSHGLQVALYAAALGLKIDRLLDIAGPVRADMLATARKAKPNIRRWTHVHSDSSDKMQWLGEFLDGHLGIVRTHPVADLNVGVPKVGHSGLLRDPKYFDLWLIDGFIDFLRGEGRHG
jgi:hypothetical protein